jgi:hypothetical protein
MTLENLRNKQVVISSLTTINGTRKQAYTTVTAALVELQPLSPEKTNLYNGQMGKTFKCFMDISADVTEGDLLREVSSGNRYKVKTGGISKRSQGSIDYLSVIVEQIN